MLKVHMNVSYAFYTGEQSMQQKEFNQSLMELNPNPMLLYKQLSRDKMNTGPSRTPRQKSSLRDLVNDQDVIHVTIDRQSLQQLTRLTEKDISQDDNVKFVGK